MLMFWLVSQIIGGSLWLDDTFSGESSDKRLPIGGRRRRDGKKGSVRLTESNRRVFPMDRRMQKKEIHTVTLLRAIEY
jgi:hypothetical protein